MATPVASQEAFNAARALTTALSSLGDALAGSDVQGVLDAEPALLLALASVTAVKARAAQLRMAGDQTPLIHELQAARAAMARCAALGASLDDFMRGRGFAAAGYDAAGAGLGPRIRPRFDQKV